MPWVKIDDEPWALPPRPRRPATAAGWLPPLDIDRGWTELSEVRVGPEHGLDLSGVAELSVKDSLIDGVPLTPPDLDGTDELALEIHRSQRDGCDLSGTAVRSLQFSALIGCKLIGTDLSGATVSDVVFERCVFRYANLRMARLRRVRFESCRFDDVDGYQLDAEHVSFPGSGLSAVNLDQLRATRVDLREATELTFSTVNQLSGCLVAEHQLVALAPALAMAAGIDVERD